MKLVVVTGIPGVGKTTVLDGALERASEEFRVVNYGDKMLSIALERRVVEDRDEMRKLDSETQKEIQRGAARSIAQEAEEKNVVVDTHCTIKTPQGYLPGLPRWVLEELRPTQVVLVEADSEEIAGRRSSDETRVRDEDTTREIGEHQDINRSTAMAYAVHTGAVVTIIKNHDDQLEKAVEGLLKAI